MLVDTHAPEADRTPLLICIEVRQHLNLCFWNARNLADSGRRVLFQKLCDFPQRRVPSGVFEGVALRILPVTAVADSAELFDTPLEDDVLPDEGVLDSVAFEQQVKDPVGQSQIRARPDEDELIRVVTAGSPARRDVDNPGSKYPPAKPGALIL